MLPGKFYYQFENKDTIFQIEGVSMMLLELNDSFGIYGNGL